MSTRLTRHAAVGVLLLAAACGSPTGPTFVPPPAGPAVLVGAGDIAVCGSDASAATAALLDQVAGTVFTAGDNTYPTGTRESFQRCYEPTWGRHKLRTRPAPGNHDYDEPAAIPYYAYFGDSAGPCCDGYYSFQVQNWLVLSLNSNVPAGTGSAQLEWLKAELATRSARCIVAIWHHPIVSSGPNGNNPEMREIWQLLHQSGTDIVINGHDHMYERFAPLDANGLPTAAGIRLFIVGTGGARLSQTRAVQRGSELRASVHGVLKLSLEQEAYDWEFIGIPGSGFTDAGRQPCR
jgi:hypothetical protein